MWTNNSSQRLKFRLESRLKETLEKYFKCKKKDPDYIGTVRTKEEVLLSSVKPKLEPSESSQPQLLSLESWLAHLDTIELARKGRQEKRKAIEQKNEELQNKEYLPAAMVDHYILSNTKPSR